MQIAILGGGYLKIRSKRTGEISPRAQGDVNYTSELVRYSLIYVDYVLVTFSYEYSTQTHYKEQPYLKFYS